MFLDMKTLVLVWAILHCIHAQGAIYLDTYDEYQQQGAFFGTIAPIPDLYNFGFDNRISSICPNGVWILYDNFNYNTGFESLDSYGVWGEVGFCLDFIGVDSSFDNKATSIRYAGNSDNGLISNTINFYESARFIGNDLIVEVNLPSNNPNDVYRSVITTGCTSWTVYAYENYDASGGTYCFVPVNCDPNFFADTSNEWPGFFGSVRQGCFSKTVIRGQSLAKEESKEKNSPRGGFQKF